jgi:hypothetical protein
METSSRTVRLSLVALGLVLAQLAWSLCWALAQ